MKLNSSEARELLEKERPNQKDDRWIGHSICVGDSAGRIARALQEKGINVDVDKTITLGYIHDIDCISNDRDETDKTNPNYDFVKDYISNEYSTEEKIINLCDLICTTKTLTAEKRMIDLLLRHGVFKKTYYHIEETMKLKEYFDNLLGYNLCDLFPEIKENL